MPDEVSPDKESPYSEKLKRPESASKAPPVSPRTQKQPQLRSKSAKSSHTRKSSPGKRHKKNKAKDKTENEIAQVSKEVKRKLELYMNEEKRQTRFNVSGLSTTTHRMAEFDIAYKLLEYDQLESKSARNPNVGGQKKGGRHSKFPDPYNIQPKLQETSRRVTGYSEADRLSKYASEVFSSYPVEKLSQIHRYRPHPKDNKKSPALGNILGYTGHVGAALHQQNYVDFYVREGMDTGDPKNSARLRKLPKNKGSHSHTSSRRTSDASSSQQSSSQASKTNHKNGRKSNVPAPKSKCAKSRKVAESTEVSVEQSIQDNVSSNTEEDISTIPAKSNHSSSTEDSSDNEGQRARPKHIRNKQDTKALRQRSRDSLDKTWAYYESGHAQESDENTTRDDQVQPNDDGIADDKAIATTDDHVAKDGYTHSDDENNNLDKSDSETDESVEKSSVISESEDDTGDEGDDSVLNNHGKRDGEATAKDEMEVRRYASVEHVREVDITEI